MPAVSVSEVLPKRLGDGAAVCRIWCAFGPHDNVLSITIAVARFQ